MHRRWRLKVLAAAAAFAIAGMGCCASAALSGSGQIPPGLSLAASPALPSGGAPSRMADPPAAPFAMSLREQFALPPLHDGKDDSAAHIADGTQVVQRARLLNVDSTSADAAWKSAADTVTAGRRILPALSQQHLRPMTFSGTRLSELNAAIAAAGPAHITVKSPKLQADIGLTITGQDLVLDFAGATIEAGANPPLWLVSVVNARDIAVINAKIDGGRNAFLVDGGSNIAIADNEMAHLSENGIVVSGASSSLDIHTNRLHQLGRAGIMLHGPVRSAVLEDNEIDQLLGHSNWNAGIVLTGRPGDVAVDPNAFFLPDRYWVITEPLVHRLENPAGNVVIGNRIRGGLSSGVYTDGAIGNVFVENRIEGNSKEGICFDNGATANVFAGNVVAGNGQRWGQPDAVLALDSVLPAGRAPDGTSLAKLPGISVDNAAYNEIYGNDIDGNFGGGVKMVRTGMFNVVLANVVSNNNLGESPSFHFFGIELGGAAADTPAVDLDFVGSSGNVVFGNLIRGGHYSGVFIGSDSLQNDVLENEIVGAKAFKVESEAR